MYAELDVNAGVGLRGHGTVVMWVNGDIFGIGRKRMDVER